MRVLRAALTAMLSFATIGAAPAQTTLADIKARLAEKTSELDEVDKMLADPVQNNRIAAMQLLLGSGDPVFVKRAKETGLFSSDPDMQAAALSAIFESGGPFRVLLDLTTAEEAKTEAKKWLRRYDGSWDETGKIGEIGFKLDPYDANNKCWMFAGSSTCAITLSGTTVSLKDWSEAGGSLTLDGSGAMVGNFRTDRADVAVPARMPLLD